MSDIKSGVPPYQEHPDVVPQPQQTYQQDMYNNQGVYNNQGIMPQGQQMYGNEMKQAPGGMTMPRQPQQYQNATPLASLGQGPTPVDCPACGTRAMTRVLYESGNTTYAWALGLCIVFCLGCIPFCMNSLKDVVHMCGNCGCRLATWHRSGAVEVHAHS